MVVLFAVAGLGICVADGGVLDKAAFASDELNFTGVGGFIVHGINGAMIIALLGLALLVISFFASVPDGANLRAIVLAAILVQVLLGHLRPRVGVQRDPPRSQRSHRFSSAAYAARLAPTTVAATPSTPRTPVTP